MNTQNNSTTRQLITIDLPFKNAILIELWDRHSKVYCQAFGEIACAMVGPITQWLDVEHVGKIGSGELFNISKKHLPEMLGRLESEGFTPS